MRLMYGCPLRSRPCALYNKPIILLDLFLLYFGQERIFYDELQRLRKATSHRSRLLPQLWYAHIRLLLFEWRNTECSHGYAIQRWSAPTATLYRLWRSTLWIG